MVPMRSWLLRFLSTVSFVVSCSKWTRVQSHNYDTSNKNHHGFDIEQWKNILKNEKGWLHLLLGDGWILIARMNAHTNLHTHTHAQRLNFLVRTLFCNQVASNHPRIMLITFLLLFDALLILDLAKYIEIRTIFVFFSHCGVAIIVAMLSCTQFNMWTTQTKSRLERIYNEYRHCVHKFVEHSR